MRPFPALCAFACMLTVTACSGGRSSPADVTGDTPSGETRFAQTDAVAPTDQGPDRSDPREDEWQPPPLDVQPPPPDDDGDGIPDSADPFPADATRPGRAMPSTVYMHTASELFSMDVKMYKVTWLGNFQWPDDGGVHKMTDIAIDRWGVLYGVSFDRLYVCHPFTAECWGQGSLPDGFNGLTLVPKGVLGDEDVLIGVSGAGHWFRLEPAPGGTVSVTELGDYGSGYSSSGDAYSIAGVGTFAAVDRPRQRKGPRGDREAGRILGHLRACRVVRPRLCLRCGRRHPHHRHEQWRGRQGHLRDDARMVGCRGLDGAGGVAPVE
jgi:hypothetical protein